MDIQDIKQAFKDNDVPLYKEDTWKVQSATVIKHSALERLGAALKIRWERPDVISRDTDNVVVMVSAYRTDKEAFEWSFGEAKIVQDGVIGGNYKVSGKQAAYPWAMAEKRAKDRVIIKLAGLHGAYSSEEADDFKDPSQKEFDDEPDLRDDGGRSAPRERKDTKPAGRTRVSRKADKDEPQIRTNPENREEGGFGDETFDAVEVLMRKIDKIADSAAVIEFMSHPETLKTTDALTDDDYKKVADYGRKRVKDLRAEEKAARPADDEPEDTMGDHDASQYENEEI